MKNRISMLLKMDDKIFHASDLASLWQITNKNTLYTVLKRYCAAGLLHRIHKGMYSVVNPSLLSDEMLAVKAVHAYCYISTETVLFENAYINQPPGSISLISEKSVTFSIMGRLVKSRQLKDSFLYNPEGISEHNGIRVASPERAICDMLYFNDKYHFDKQPDWKRIKKLQQSIGYQLTPQRYDFAVKK